jgi:OPA family glycerol-3-phosphate transporter-like MFS transporter
MLKKPGHLWIITSLAWLVYVTVYFGRVNLSITIPLLEKEEGYSKTALGFLASVFFIAYAGGQLINGAWGDHFRARFLVSLGLLTAGLSNILFALVHTLPLMGICWAFNGYFQSMIWGPLVRSISDSAPEEKMYKAMSFMATSPVIGYFLSYTLIGKLTLSRGWKFSFLLPGFMFLAVAALWFFGAKGLDAGIKSRNRHEERALPFLKGMVTFVKSSKIYFILIMGLLIGIIREGLSLWAPAFFSERESIGMEKALFIMSLMPLFNLIFIILNGIAFNRWKINMFRSIFVFLIGASVSAVLFCAAGAAKESLVLFPVLLIAFYGLMASIYTANNIMTSYVPLIYKRDRRVSLAAGVIDSSFYIGAAIAGPAAGAAAEHFGWTGIFGGIIAVCLAAVGLLIIIRTSLYRLSIPALPEKF